MNRLKITTVTMSRKTSVQPSPMKEFQKLPMTPYIPCPNAKMLQGNRLYPSSVSLKLVLGLPVLQTGLDTRINSLVHTGPRALPVVCRDIDPCGMS